jgi:hypothetical protein
MNTRRFVARALTYLTVAALVTVATAASAGQYDNLVYDSNTPGTYNYFSIDSTKSPATTAYAWFSTGEVNTGGDNCVDLTMQTASNNNTTCGAGNDCIWQFTTTGHAWWARTQSSADYPATWHEVSSTAVPDYSTSGTTPPTIMYYNDSANSGSYGPFIVNGDAGTANECDANGNSHVYYWDSSSSSWVNYGYCATYVAHATDTVSIFYTAIDSSGDTYLYQGYFTSTQLGKIASSGETVTSLAAMYDSSSFSFANSDCTAGSDCCGGANECVWVIPYTVTNSSGYGELHWWASSSGGTGYSVKEIGGSSSYNVQRAVVDPQGDYGTTPYVWGTYLDSGTQNEASIELGTF